MDFLKVATELTPALLSGLWVTVWVTVVSLLIALVLGLLSCIMGLSKIKIVSGISKLYLWIIRGTPFIVQIFIIYFGIPQFMKFLHFTDFRLSVYQAAIATLSLNAGAYISEIFRGGIAAVDIGQMEAARSLGLPKSSAMSKVILPQALKISIPSLCNQFIITLKDSSLAYAIGLPEIVYKGKIYVGRTMQSFSSYILVGIVYLVVITILTQIIKIIERKLDYGKKG